MSVSHFHKPQGRTSFSKAETPNLLTVHLGRVSAGAAEQAHTQPLVSLASRATDAARNPTEATPCCARAPAFQGL